MDLRKSPNENQHQYIWRVCSAKDNGEINLSWEQLAEIFNRELEIPDDKQQTEASFRKPFQQAKLYFDNVFAPMIEKKGADGLVEALIQQREELYAVKTQVQDQRRAYTRNIRNISRLDQRIDLLEEAIVQSSAERYQSVKPGFT